MSYTGTSISTLSINIPTTASATVGIIRQNSLPFLHSFGSDYNLFMGGAGNFTLSGAPNIIIGKSSATLLTSGGQNTSLGTFNLGLLTTGSNNIAISGALASFNNITSGTSNIGINGGSGHTLADSSNICINNNGVAGESNTVRFGTYGTGLGFQKICYMDPTFVASNGNIEKTTSVTTATYTALTTDRHLICNRAGVIAITLLASPETGRLFTIKDTSGAAASNNITITAAAGNIDGAASLVLGSNYGSYTLIYNGTQWNVI